MTVKQLKNILSLFEDDVSISKLWTLKRTKQYHIKFYYKDGATAEISGKIKKYEEVDKK
jgi:hypothetical protein